jgi:acyl carrier protein
MQALKAQLRETITQALNLQAEFGDQSDFYRELGVSSVHAISLLFQLEERYSVTIPDDRFVECTTLDQLTCLMAELLAESNASTLP